MNHLQFFSTFTDSINESMDSREFLMACREIDTLRNSKTDSFKNRGEIKKLLDEYDKIDPRFSSRYAAATIRTNLSWLANYMRFFYATAQQLNIYGSSKINPKTMCTNGLNIVYHPEFVSFQSNGAIRFVLVHEVLHCLFQHMTRRLGRKPTLWNYATDFAINPILDAECQRWGKEFEWPKDDQGGKMGLYEEKYLNMPAEEIYGKLEIDGVPPDKKPLDDVHDYDKPLPKPDSPDDVVKQAEDEDDQFDNTEDEIDQMGPEDPTPDDSDDSAQDSSDSDDEDMDDTTDGGEEGPPQEKRQAQAGDIIRIDQGPLQGKYAEVSSVNPATGEMDLEEITKEEAIRRRDSKPPKISF